MKQSMRMPLWCFLIAGLLHLAFWFFVSDGSPFVQYFYNHQETVPAFSDALNHSRELFWVTMIGFPGLVMLVLNNPEPPLALMLIASLLQWTCIFWILAWVATKIRTFNSPAQVKKRRR